MPVRNTSSCSRRPPSPTRTSRDTAATHDCGSPSATTAVTRCTGESTLNRALAQDAGGALQQRVPEVDVDDVVPALGHLLVERDRAQDARVQPGLQAAQRELPRRAERGDLEDLRRVIALDRAERRLAGQLQRGVDDAPRVRGRQVHLGLAVVVGAGQFGEGAVQFLAAGERRG